MKKKGFTLIELLAVILILGIIALIAVPAVTNIINESKENAAKVSATNYINSVDNYLIMQDLKGYEEKLENGKTYMVADETIYDLSTEDEFITRQPTGIISDTIYLNEIIKMNGNYPLDGYAIISNNKVEYAKIAMNGYVVEYGLEGNSIEVIEKYTSDIVYPESITITNTETEIEKNDTLQLTLNITPEDATKKVRYTSSDETKATVSKTGLVTALKGGEVTITVQTRNNLTASIDLTVLGGPTYIAPGENDTHKGIVYLDPTNLTRTCNQSNSIIGSGISGCMKWYVYNDTSDNYKMILEHNTSDKIVFNVNNWNNSPSAEFTSSLTNLVSVTGWKVTPRLISANEIATITGNTSFNTATASVGSWFYLDSNNQTKTASSKGASRYAWLFDYTMNCQSSGCNIQVGNNNYGYWTSDKMATVNNGHIWVVRSDGSLGSTESSSSTMCIRPVIEVPKSIF